MAASKQTLEMRRRLGRRIRRRRLFANMTQAALARSLGITFQQVQKYENGANSVTAERLAAIAKALDVTPDYFANGAAASEEADALEHFVQSPQGLALYRAMACLSDPQQRAKLIVAVEAVSDSHMAPEDAEAQALATWLRHVTAKPDNTDVTNAIHAAKIEVAQLIGKTLKARKLTQKFAAQILHTDQARISALARGDVTATSLEKLLRHLMLLGWDAQVAIAKRPAGRRGKIAVTSGG